MISFYLVWTGSYLVLLVYLSLKWPKHNPKDEMKDQFPSVTLLIPFRNELENLPKLTAEFQKIGYPNLEILLIDDQSEDGSAAFLHEKLKSDQRVKVLQSVGIGKKKAIEFGVETAKSELILCSDADCTFPEDWVFQMISPFSNPKTQLVAGTVMSQGSTTFFQRFQQIEWCSILLVTQYFFSQKQPIMCSGANLAYRKTAFEAVSGYDQNSQHLSGDDEFLLKKVLAHFGGDSCIYLPFSRNLVETKAEESISSLINQRVRWAGKWKVHRDPTHALTAIVSFLIQLVWLGSVVLLAFGNWVFLAFFLVWSGKIAAERIALGRVLSSFGMNLGVFDYMKTGILHPFYVIYVALESIRGKFHWKGRNN